MSSVRRLLLVNRSKKRGKGIKDRRENDTMSNTASTHPTL